MSYHDAWQAYGDWIDSTDADYLKHEGIQDGDIWDCPECEMPTFIYEEAIEGSNNIIEGSSNNIIRGCQRCDHQIVCQNGDDTGIR